MLKIARILCIAAGCSMCLMPVAGTAQPKGDQMVIENGKEVSLDYTLTVDGSVIDSSEEGELFIYTHGSGEILPALSDALEGMKVGEVKTITLLPDQAYGGIDETAMVEVPRSSLPGDMEPQPGMVLQAHGPDGETMLVRIQEVKADVVVIDFNHPLAGKTLIFNVKVESIK